MLTKTNYLTYLQCPKSFWLAIHRPDLKSPPDEVAQRRFQIGQEIDRLAQERFDNGRCIPYRPNLTDMAELTAQAINGGDRTLFQATIAHDDMLIKADVLRQDEAGWHLIEVKSTTRVKDEHLPDAAFQMYVLQKAGFDVVSASVMHLNKACCYPDLSNLFTISDVTDSVTSLLQSVDDDVAFMRTIANLPTMPNVAIGRHCRKPHDCPFYDVCWQGIDGLTIFDISRLSGKKEQMLREEGVLHLADVPDTFALSPTQREFVDFINHQRINIDVPAIQRALVQLEYPLHFFDFETIDYAEPCFEGCVPYQQVPFQYSCHVLERNGRLHHHEFLHTDDSDPRRTLTEALLTHIGETGSIIAYYIPFEKRVLRDLATAFPAYASRLQAMADRLWDQLNIFKKHYRDYRFGKSNSLKSVLPVLVPELSYGALDVQNGLAAQLAWLEMLACDDASQKQQLIEQLLAYCHLDTLAMVEMYRILAALPAAID